MQRQEARTILAAMWPFSELEPACLDRLLEAGRLEHHEQRTLLVQENDPAEHLLVLLDGEVAVRQDGMLTRLVPAPDLLGLLAVIEQGRRSATLQAFSRVTVLTVSRGALWEAMGEHPPLSEGLLRYLGRELARMYRRERVWMDHMEDFFQSPNARIVSGPYQARPFEMIFLVVRGDRERLRQLLHPALRLLPGTEGTLLLTFNFFDALETTNPLGEGRSFDYNETTPFIPCLGPGGRPGVFCPELYPDNYLAITIGRELYGFPKRFGITERKERNIDFILDSHLVLRARWEGARDCGTDIFTRDVLEASGVPGALSSFGGQLSRAMHGLYRRRPHKRIPVSVPVYVHRQVPAVQTESRWVYAHDQLLLIPFQMSALQRVQVLDGVRLACMRPEHFLSGRALCGFSLELSFGFHRSRILHEAGETAVTAHGSWSRRIRSLVRTIRRGAGPAS